MSAADLSPAVVRDETKDSTARLLDAGFHFATCPAQDIPEGVCTCRSASPVSVPEPSEPTAPYVGSENIDPALRDELREWQTASAHTFLRFEAALDDNSEHFDTGPALSFEDALRVGGCPVSPPRVEGLPEQDFTTGLETSKPMCVGIDMRCAECGNRVEAIREHLTHDGHCLYTAYQRQQSALDALAVAVKPFAGFIADYESEWRDGEWGRETADLKRLQSAIQQLLQTRET